jgi:hypothetical protein
MVQNRCFSPRYPARKNSTGRSCSLKITHENRRRASWHPDRALRFIVLSHALLKRHEGPFLFLLLSASFGVDATDCLTCWDITRKVARQLKCDRSATPNNLLRFSMLAHASDPIEPFAYSGCCNKDRVHLWASDNASGPHRAFSQLKTRRSVAWLASLHRAVFCLRLVFEQYGASGAAPPLSIFTELLGDSIYLTAPDVKPRIRKRWKIKARTTGGMLAKTPAAAIRKYSRPSFVLNSPINTGSVLASTFV